jgi:hypothetical protein
MNNLLRSQSAVLCAHSLPRLPEWYVSSLVAPRLASCLARYGTSMNFVIFQEKYYE